MKAQSPWPCASYPVQIEFDYKRQVSYGAHHISLDVFHKQLEAAIRCSLSVMQHMRGADQDNVWSYESFLLRWLKADSVSLSSL